MRCEPKNRLGAINRRSLWLAAARRNPDRLKSGSQV